VVVDNYNSGKQLLVDLPCVGASPGGKAMDDITVVAGARVGGGEEV
jgi:hypothetical protein